MARIGLLQFIAALLAAIHGAECFAPSYLGAIRARYLASSASSHGQPRFAGPRFASSRPSGALSLSALSVPASRPLSQRATKFLERIPGNPIKGFEAADRAWTNVRSDSFTTPPASPAVVEKPGESFLRSGASPDYDFVVCGGTLGIFVAAALQVRGYKVAVVEQGKLVGRTQEWNISRKELEVLAELGILTPSQLDETIVTEYNPQRVGFTAGGKPYELNTIRGVLNLGVDPLTLVQLVKDKFLVSGGTLLEERGFSATTVYADCASVTLKVKGGAPAGAMGAGGDAAFSEGGDKVGEEVITGKIVLDAMGNFSPIMRQARGFKKPDGVCMVVGTCARGDWIDNSFGDLIYSFTPIMGEKQYFWEAFPSTDKHGSGETSRTTYMFTYIDSDAARGSIAEMFDDYLDLLPKYSGARGTGGQVPDVDTMPTSRALCGLFPCYTDSPLPVKYDRIFQVGDTSGLQSPLSFGGFGSLLRHLKRVSDGLCEAVDEGLTSKEDLDAMQPYLPSLSTMWLFQKAMSVKVGTKVSDPDIINRVLASNFATMEKLGSGVMMPFLQDVIQLPGLASTIAGMSFFDPLLIPPLLLWVGPLPVITWTVHFAALALYSVLYNLSEVVSPSVEEGMDARSRFFWRRKKEAWKYGSGNDY